MLAASHLRQGYCHPPVSTHNCTGNGLIHYIQFSSRWYLCAWNSPYALHPNSQKFPHRCLWNGSNVRLTDVGSLSSFQGRLSSASSFHAPLLQAIDGVMSLALCPLVVSEVSVEEPETLLHYYIHWCLTIPRLAVVKLLTSVFPPMQFILPNLTHEYLCSTHTGMFTDSVHIGTDFPTSELLSAIQPNFKSKNELQNLKYSCLKYERQNIFKYWLPAGKVIVHAKSHQTRTAPAEEERKNPTMQSVLRLGLGWGRALFCFQHSLFYCFLTSLFLPSVSFLPAAS